MINTPPASRPVPSASGLPAGPRPPLTPAGRRLRDREAVGSDQGRV